MGYVGRGLNQEGGQYRKLDDISSGFNGSETSFSLTVSNLAVTPTAQNLLISINGVIQEPGSAFSMNGSTITFTEAPAGAASFFGVVMGEASYIAYDTVGANELGVTAGTVKASRGVVVDTSSNVSGFNQITSTTFSGIFSGALSSSAQIATDISGSITESSASFSTRVTNTESSASQLNQDLKTSASPTFTGGTYTSDLGVSGSMTVKGTLTAQEFKTEFVSASILFDSGSTKFGDTAGDIHQMTGSLRITGSGDHYFQTGKVGIGVTNPSSFYESHLVVGDGTGEEAISIYGGSTSTGYLLFADSSSGSGRYAGQVRYNFNTNDLVFATNNVSTARMTIDSSGNVAIGSHSPSSLLDVRGNSSIVGFGTDSSADFGETYFASGTAINFGYGTNSNTGGIINYRGYQNDSSQFRDLTIMDGKGNVVAFFDGSEASVGVGTNSPGYQLDLRRNDTGTTPSLGIRQIGTGDASMAFQTTTSPYGFIIGVDASDSERFKIATGVSDVGGSGEKMSIDPGGMVTFINASARWNFYADSDTDLNMYFAGHDTSDTIRIAAGIGVVTTAQSNACDGDLTFSTSTSNNPTERMRITSGALVQINQNNAGSAGTSNKSLSLGGAVSTQFDRSNVGTMTGMLVSNSYTSGTNQSGTATGIVFTHHTSSSGISYIASVAGSNSGDRSALHFGTRGSSGVKERLLLNDNGEVYIGHGGDGYLKHYQINSNSHHWVLYPYSDDSYRFNSCLLYTSPSPRDKRQSRMPSSA